ncbi:protein kinase domain-containing protein [Hamadaea tsunoensis]|uniref:protein kinase domain-containing protein n=1 Tax=Hamadaea tsunoensis TaxID=53368 RepID=UPI00146FB6A3|nr:cellulose binding domain-containing protein [Hamadaea tsunoensis]
MATFPVTPPERYRLLEPVGEGGSSVVWRGYDEVLRRPVAVKVLAARLAADPAVRRAVRREAQLAAQLAHPHVARVYDYGETEVDGEPVCFVVMELVEGHSLARELAAGPLPVPLALRIAGETADALAAAHALGLVHCDVTPANILLGAVGVQVTDFGISTTAGSVHTRLLGTPGFVAPERRQGQPALPASDVYSLGRVVREMVGDQPLPAPVARLAERCLATDPAARPTAAELAAALAGPRVPLAVRSLPAAIANPTRLLTPVRRPVGRWFALAAVLVLVAAAAFYGLSPRSTPEAAGPTAGPIATAGPSPVPPPEPSCTVAYRVTSDWEGGFGASIAVRTTRESLSGWTLTFTFTGDEQVQQGWDGEFSQSGRTVTVRDKGYNASVAPDKQVGMGFNGSVHDHATGPAGFTLNGEPCVNP